jgi:hypothetical protein
MLSQHKDAHIPIYYSLRLIINVAKNKVVLNHQNLLWIEGSNKVDQH